VDLAIEKRKCDLANNTFNPIGDASEEAVLRLAQVNAEYCVLAYKSLLLNKTRNVAYFDDPLAFWRMMEGVDNFVSISYIARMYLTIQATSSESERLFSKAGMVYTARRSQLSDNNFCNVIFFNSLEKTLCQAYNT